MNYDFVPSAASRNYVVSRLNDFFVQFKALNSRLSGAKSRFSNTEMCKKSSIYDHVIRGCSAHLRISPSYHCLLKYFSRLLILVFFLFGASLAKANINGLWIFPASEAQTLQNSGSIKIPADTYKIQTIKHLPRSLWETADINAGHYGFYTGPVWFRMTLDPNPLNEERILFISNSNLDSLNVYQMDENRSQPDQNLSIKDQSNPIDGFHLFGPNAGIAYSLAPKAKEVYLQVRNDGPLFMPIQVVNQKQFTEFQTSMTWIFGVLFGLFAMAILVFARLIYTHRIKSLFYGFCLLITLILYLFASYGLLQSLFYEQWQSFQAPLLLTLMSLFGICCLRVEYHSLRPNQVDSEASAKAQKIIRNISSVIESLLILPLIGYLAVSHTGFHLSVLKIFHIPGILLTLFIATIISSFYHKSNPPQGFLLLTWLSLIAFVISEALVFIGPVMIYNFELVPQPGLSLMTSSLSVLFLVIWSLDDKNIQSPETQKTLHHQPIQKEQFMNDQLLNDQLLNDQHTNNQKTDQPKTMNSLEAALNTLNETQSKPIAKNKPISVLVVHHNQAELTELAAQLKHKQLMVHTAMSGQEAINSTYVESINYILMDIRLPDMSGFKACENILSYSKNIVIIGLSTEVSSDLSQDAINSGMQALITMPKSKAQIDSLLKNHLNS